MAACFGVSLICASRAPIELPDFLFGILAAVVLDQHPVDALISPERFR
jgi:hypothetical protein